MGNHRVSRYCTLLGAALAILVGCARQTPTSPLEPPLSILLSPTPVPVSTTPPPLPSTSTPQPTPTPTLVPSSTPTYPPYEDKPFTIVFLRDGNLWLSEVGGDGEYQLTTESTDWPVYEYAVSPECDRIAYIAYREPPEADGLIKQVHIPTGSVSVVTGENDPYIEWDVGWPDSNHITFLLSEFTASGYTKETPAWNGIEPFNHIVFNLTTGERVFVPESLGFSQSPNGRYWLTGSCSYVYECPLDYVLHDLTTGEEWQVSESIGRGAFLGWSPDSQWMLFFSDYRQVESDALLQLRLVNTETHEAEEVTPDDTDVFGAAWSPDSQSIAFAQRDIEGQSLWVMDRDGGNRRRVAVQVTDLSGGLDWSPDGSRLVFATSEDHDLAVWSVRVDGSDLRRIIERADQPRVLCER